MSVAPITAALVLDGVRGMNDSERAELRELLGITNERPLAYATGPVAYTTASLAAMLGITERAVRGAIVRGDLTATRRGRRWLIDHASVERYVAPPQRETAPNSRSQARRRRRPMAEALARMPEDA